jgi:hypothetical protein
LFIEGYLTVETIKATDFPEELVASSFRVHFDPAKGSSKFLQNIGNFYHFNMVL